MNSYNGFSGKEREAKLRAQHALNRRPDHPPATRCSICDDPAEPLEAHDEDYSKPYVWEPPAQYAVCHKCHSRIHARFRNPKLWEAHKAHVKRAGYASEQAEFETLRAQQLSSAATSIQTIRHRNLTGSEWWEKLTLEIP
jgi:hypothetical protein